MFLLTDANLINIFVIKKMHLITYYGFLSIYNLKLGFYVI